MREFERVILQKMKDYAVQTVQFKGEMDFAEFSNDPKTIAACVFNLGQIGELVGKLDDDFIKENGQIPWRKIKGMRNKIIHDYEGVLLNIVWDVIVDYLPELIVDIDKILPIVNG